MKITYPVHERTRNGIREVDVPAVLWKEIIEQHGQPFGPRHHFYILRGSHNTLLRTTRIYVANRSILHHHCAHAVELPNLGLASPIDNFGFLDRAVAVHPKQFSDRV